MLLLLLLHSLFALAGLGSSSSNAPTLHFPIQRRGGVFPLDDVANFTFLNEQLNLVTSRFNLTRREIKGNKVVRKPAARNDVDGIDGKLMGDVGRPGAWYTTLRLGEPEQALHMDLDMLTSDFLVYSTTSHLGTSFTDIFSRTYETSSERPFPGCRLPTDLVHLPTTNASLRISFAYCRPSKSSARTLEASGALLGLAPSGSLSQTGTPSLSLQLLQQGAIRRSIWSILLINGQDGVFSVGGTSAEAVDLVQQEMDGELDRLGQMERSAAAAAADGKGKRAKRDEAPVLPSPAWQWNPVQGAAGWWQILMHGVWVEGRKVLKNQPVIMDVNTPFILAPPASAAKLYAAIPGARPLAAPHDRFYVFPCLNPARLGFEFSGRLFPVLQGDAVRSVGPDLVFSRPGGKFSLGRMKAASGYCVGAVVEMRDGVEGDGTVRGAGGGRGRVGRHERSADRGGGHDLDGMWILGEPFFRAVGVSFNVSMVSFVRGVRGGMPTTDAAVVVVSDDDGRLPDVWLMHCPLSDDRLRHGRRRRRANPKGSSASRIQVHASIQVHATAS
ncbi:MAG: hypothetical protein M1826_001867 [Phylliscum demangeonii]|nr:MAG: hypothetical protein M1826_001867 [Phylliscum demangeonii]